MDLSSQDLTVAIPDLSGLTTLISLNLSNNSFTGLLPAWVAGLTSLKTLDVSNNQLSGPIGDEIWANKSLVTVDLSSNQFNGTIPGRLLQQLRSSMEFGVAGNVLNLSSNGLTGRIPDTLTANAGEGVFTVDLSNNGLDGSIPSSFGRLAIGALRLQNNRLEGEIGSGWSKSMPNLIFLDLSDNLLSGRIPNLLPNLLPNLRSLDLSGNRLSGKIALNFTLMPNLTFLNLSNNRLSGRIPNLPPHLLSAASFAGNPDLCGPPLQRRCRNTLVVKLAAGLVACALLFAGTCLFFAWRLRRHSKRHRQDADLIAILQGRKRANLMTLADLRKATSNFSKECQIGVGGFGEVYKGKLNDGTLVAIKKSKRQGSQRDKDQFLNKVEILSQVNHRFLVRLLGCCLANKVALLVFEFVPNGTLEEHLRSTTPGAPPLTWMERLRIALQTADALAYLHSSANPPIFHRDVKSANILLDQNMDAKVADFGISKLAPLHATHVSTAAVQGTPGYIDPEYHVSFQLTAKSDVFSFGVVLLELISGRSPLEPERGSEDASLIGVAVPLIKSGNMEEVIDPSIFLTSSDLEKVKESVVAVGALAVKCLELKSEDRPNMREVFKDLQILGLQFDASTVFDISDQGELGSGLSDLENPPDDDYIEFLNSRSFHGSSTTRNLSSLRKLADIEEQMGSLNR